MKASLTNSFFFTLAAIWLSLITPHPHLHPLHATCALFFTCLVHSLLLLMVFKLTVNLIQLHYLYFFHTFLFVSLFSVHSYSVLILLTFIPLLLLLSRLFTTCSLLIDYNSGPQPPGRGPVAVRGLFGTRLHQGAIS